MPLVLPVQINQDLPAQLVSPVSQGYLPAQSCRGANSSLPYGNKGLGITGPPPEDVLVFEVPLWAAAVFAEGVSQTQVCTQAHTRLGGGRASTSHRITARAALLTLPPRNFDPCCVTEEKAQPCPQQPLPPGTSKRKKSAFQSVKVKWEMHYILPVAWFTRPRYQHL